MKTDTLDQAKLSAEIAKLMAETNNLNASTRKFTVEAILYPFVAGSATAGAIIAITKLFL